MCWLVDTAKILQLLFVFNVMVLEPPAPASQITLPGRYPPNTIKTKISDSTHLVI